MNYYKDYYVLKVKKGKLTANINHKNPNLLYSDKGFFVLDIDTCQQKVTRAKYKLMGDFFLS